MARPKKNSVDYFPHDSDARNDAKLRIMRHHYGNNGYAFYFILLELIYSNNGCLDLSNNLMVQDIAITVGVEETAFNEMLTTAIDLGLFDISYYETKLLTSNGIGKRIALINKERAKWRNQKFEFSTMENSSKVGFSTMENSSKAGFSTMENPLKGKRKEKENGPEPDSTDSFSDFSDWWRIYAHSPYPDSEKRCLALWQALSVEERRRAVEVVAAYVRARPDKQFRKNPANYLREKRFNEVLNAEKTDRIKQEQPIYTVEEYIPSRRRIGS